MKMGAVSYAYRWPMRVSGPHRFCVFFPLNAARGRCASAHSGVLCSQRLRVLRASRRWRFATTLSWIGSAMQEPLVGAFAPVPPCQASADALPYKHVLVCCQPARTTGTTLPSILSCGRGDIATGDSSGREHRPRTTAQCDRATSDLRSLCSPRRGHWGRPSSRRHGGVRVHGGEAWYSLLASGLLPGVLERAVTAAPLLYCTMMETRNASE